MLPKKNLAYQNTKRFVCKISGESGQGIKFAGELLSKTWQRQGYHLFTYREYPSLIKGGVASLQIDIAKQKVQSSSKFCHLLLCLNRESIHKYLFDLAPHGILIHTIKYVVWSTEEQAYLTKNNIKIKQLDLDTISQIPKGERFVDSMVLLGYTWSILQIDLLILKSVLANFVSGKPALLKLDKQLLQIGYKLGVEQNKNFLKNNFKDKIKFFNLPIKPLKDHLLITGNETLALGSLVAGVRAVYAYPMTPATSIFTFLANTYRQTGVLVKQAEDEITAVQMALGSMFMGTRALVVTSGGGFDLMTETISLAGMTETPLVIVLAQRPGPATGLPTWTATGDLNIAIYSGHGEFPRCVLAVSDAESAFVLIQKAYNLAEKWQIPVIILTEKQIAESQFTTPTLSEKVPINRSLTLKVPSPSHKTSKKSALTTIATDIKTKNFALERYEQTKLGVSARWLPGTLTKTYIANGDEHKTDGSVTENAHLAKEMMDKRNRKMKNLAKVIPEPQLYGSLNAKVTLIGWGSVKNTILDILAIFKANKVTNVSWNYLHFSYIYPLPKKTLIKMLNHSFILIENNQQGQLGQLITQHTGITFIDKWLKYDGRPFMVEDLLKKLTNLKN